MSTVQGYCHPAFTKLKDLLTANVASEAELGACICINVDGENVVDLWAGHADTAKTKKWEKDTIVNVWSCSKIVTNLALLMVADRGLLSLHDPVTSHWPEFARNDKQSILVRNNLSHTSGLSGWEKPFTKEEMCDLELSTAKLAAQKPWWDPGTASGYHAMNQGHLVGELVRRATFKSLTRFIAEEIAGPLGADFQLGAQEDDLDRISTLIAPPDISALLATMDQDSVAVKTLTSPAMTADFALTSLWRKAEIGAANGHSNARALNRIASAITLGGELDGTRLLSPETIACIFEEQSNGVDLVVDESVRFGMGYGLPCGEAMPAIPEGGKIAFWCGWGGSCVIMDLDHRMTFTYVMNKMDGGTLSTPRNQAYIEAAYEAVKSLDGISAADSKI